MTITEKYEQKIEEIRKKIENLVKAGNADPKIRKEFKGTMNNMKKEIEIYKEVLIDINKMTADKAH